MARLAQYELDEHQTCCVDIPTVSGMPPLRRTRLDCVTGRYTWWKEFMCITCTAVVVYCLAPIFCEAKFCGVLWTRNVCGQHCKLSGFHFEVSRLSWK